MEFDGASIAPCVLSRPRLDGGVFAFFSFPRRRVAPLDRRRVLHTALAAPARTPSRTASFLASWMVCPPPRNLA